MRFADMDEWVTRRMLDVDDQDTTPASRKSALNVAAQLVQKRVQQVDPDAFRRIYTRNLQVNENRYQLPRGVLRAKRVAIGGTRAIAVPEDWILFPDREEQGFMAQLGAPGYAIAGNELIVSPTPTADVEDGLVLKYVPALAMDAADDDLQDVGLVEPLHIGVVLWAVKLLKPETGERDPALDDEINSVLSDIGTYYPLHQPSAEPVSAFRAVGLGKELGGL